MLAKAGCAVVLLSAVCAAAQVIGVQPQPLGMYGYNTTTHAWERLTNTGTEAAASSTPQPTALYGFNTSLGQWTPFATDGSGHVLLPWDAAGLYGTPSIVVDAVTANSIETKAINNVVSLDNAISVCAAINALSGQTGQLNRARTLDCDATVPAGSAFNAGPGGMLSCGAHVFTSNGPISGDLSQHFDPTCVGGTNLFLNKPAQNWQAIWFSATDPAAGAQQITKAVPQQPFFPSPADSDTPGAPDIYLDGYNYPVYTHTPFNSTTAARVTGPAAGTIYCDAWPCIGGNSTFADSTFPLFSFGGKLGSSQSRRGFGINWGYPATGYVLTSGTITIYTPFTPSQVNSPAGTPYVLSLAHFGTSTWLDSTTMTVTSIVPNVSITGTWSGSHANASATEAGRASFPGNLRTLTDCSLPIHSTTMTCASGAFSTADTAAQVRLVWGGNAGCTVDLVHNPGDTAGLTIASVTNSTTVELSTPGVCNQALFGAVAIIIPQGSTPVQLTPFRYSSASAMVPMLHDMFIDGGKDPFYGPVGNDYCAILGSFPQPLQQGTIPMERVLLQGCWNGLTILGASNNPATELRFREVFFGTDANIHYAPAIGGNFTLGPMASVNWDGGVNNSVTTGFLLGANHVSSNSAWIVQGFHMTNNTVNTLGGLGSEPAAGPPLGPMVVYGSSIASQWTPDYDELEGQVTTSPAYFVPPQAAIQLGTAPNTDSTLACTASSTTITATDHPFGWRDKLDEIALPGCSSGGGLLTATITGFTDDNTITVDVAAGANATGVSGYWGGGGPDTPFIHANRFYSSSNSIYNIYVANPWVTDPDVDIASWIGTASKSMSTASPPAFDPNAAGAVSGGSFAGNGSCDGTLSGGGGTGATARVYISNGALLYGKAFYTATGINYTGSPTSLINLVCSPLVTVTSTPVIAVKNGTVTGYTVGFDPRATRTMGTFKLGTSSATPVLPLGVKVYDGATGTALPYHHAKYWVDGQQPGVCNLESSLIGDGSNWRFCMTSEGILNLGDGTNISGMLYGTSNPFTYVSGSSGCSNGTRTVTFIDPGGTGVGTGTITVSGTVPTGTVTLNAGSSGFSALPTTGAISTCTGTATFSGGSVVNHYAGTYFFFNSGLPNPQEEIFGGSFYADYLYGGTGLAVGGGNVMTGNQGNGAKVQHSTGSTTTDNLLKSDANGNSVDSGVSATSGLWHPICSITTGGDAICAQRSDSTIGGLTCGNSADALNASPQTFVAQCSIPANYLTVNGGMARRLKIVAQFENYTPGTAPSIGTFVLGYGASGLYSLGTSLAFSNALTAQQGWANFEVSSAAQSGSTSVLTTDGSLNLGQATVANTHNGAAAAAITTNAIAAITIKVGWASTGLVSVNYASGGTISGTGTCALTVFNNGGASTPTAVLNVTAGVVSSITVSNTGYGFTAAPTSATATGSGSGGQATCSGTVTLSGGVLGGAQGTAMNLKYLGVDSN